MNINEIGIIDLDGNIFTFAAVCTECGDFATVGTWKDDMCVSCT